MSAPDDGGMAFPGFEYTSGYGCSKPFVMPSGEVVWQVHQTGASLRDFFAAAESIAEWDDNDAVISTKLSEALAGEKMPSSGWAGDPLEMLRFEAKWRAALKYIRADAMLAERAKRKDAT